MDKGTAYNRRQLLRIGAMLPIGLAVACAQTPVPVTGSPPATAQPSTLSTYIKGIADSVLGSATQWGVSAATIATLTADAQTLEGIADKVSSALAASGAIATYANDALPIIETIVSFIPGGSAATGILTAIQTLTPIIAATAGKQMATRPTGLTPDLALGVLRRAAVGVL